MLNPNAPQLHLDFELLISRLETKLEQNDLKPYVLSERLGLGRETIPRLLSRRACGLKVFLLLCHYLQTSPSNYYHFTQKVPK